MNSKQLEDLDWNTTYIHGPQPSVSQIIEDIKRNLGEAAYPINKNTTHYTAKEIKQTREAKDPTLSGKSLSPNQIKRKIRAQHIVNLLITQPWISYTEIAKRLHISRPTLYDIMEKENTWAEIKTKIKKTRKNREITNTLLGIPQTVTIEKTKQDMYEECYKRAKNQQRHSVDITLKYMLHLAEKQNHKCALTGIPFTFTKISEQRHDALHPSIDRVNSDHGYIPGNVQWTTVWANLAKQDYSNNFFIEMCQKVAENTTDTPQP